jgi:hypothetical protein
MSLKLGRFLGASPINTLFPGDEKDGVFTAGEQNALSLQGNWGRQIQTPVVVGLNTVGFGITAQSTLFYSGIPGDSISSSRWNVYSSVNGAIKTVSNIQFVGFTTNRLVKDARPVYDPLNDDVNSAYPKSGIGASFSFTYNELGLLYDTLHIQRRGEGYSVGEKLRIYEQGGGGAKYIDFTVSQVYNSGDLVLSGVGTIGAGVGVGSTSVSYNFLRTETNLDSDQEYSYDVQYFGTSGKTSIKSSKTTFRTENDSNVAWGEQLITGSQYFTVPAGVKRITVICISNGGNATGQGGGRGGDLRYYNHIEVTPGELLYVRVSDSTYGTCIQRSPYNATSTIFTAGYVSANAQPVASTPLTIPYIGGGNGAGGGYYLGDSNNGVGGSGGAGGYSGPGGGAGRGDSDYCCGRGGVGYGGGGGGGSASAGPAGGVQIYGESYSGSSYSYNSPPTYFNGYITGYYPSLPNNTSTPTGLGGYKYGTQGQAGSWIGLGGPPSNNNNRKSPSNPGVHGGVNSYYGGGAYSSGAGTGAVRILWGNGLRQFPKQMVNKTDEYISMPGSNV